jgi:tetratricopeptide (TPR) repeat protein
MTGNARKRIRGLVGSAAVILMICSANIFAAQEKVSPLSDYQYKRDFAQYDAAKKETDTQKRADLMMAFIKERPISRMLMYAVTDYIEYVKPLLAKNDFAKAIPMLEALQTLLPTEKAVQDAGIPAGVDEFLKDQLKPSQQMILSLLVGAYYQSQNWPKAAEMAEKLYELNQDKGTLPVLADIYLKIQNVEKYLATAQKILAAFPMDQPQGYATAIQTAQVYIQKQDTASAIDLLTKVMDVYGDKIPPNTPEPQWNATRAFAYGVIASGIYAKKEYAKALEVYDKVVKFDPKRDDAHYYIGMCKWQTQNPEGAIESFANCVVLNGQFAKRAQQYLEQLYKARHNDSLDGLDQVLAKAKAAVGN